MRDRPVAHRVRCGTPHSHDHTKKHGLDTQCDEIDRLTSVVSSSTDWSRFSNDKRYLIFDKNMMAFCNSIQYKLFLL